ncbi:hypothetical protein ACLKA7_007049 [Drosophila subpalustris]
MQRWRSGKTAAACQDVHFISQLALCSLHKGGHKRRVSSPGKLLMTATISGSRPNLLLPWLSHKLFSFFSGTISIYSDSQAAIRSIAATTTKSTSVSKCRKSLHEMAEHFDICLIWVPGHQDISGNCVADELARQGTTEILLPDKKDTITYGGITVWWVAWPDKRGNTSAKPEPLPCVTSAEMNALSSSDP